MTLLRATQAESVTNEQSFLCINCNVAFTTDHFKSVSGTAETRKRRGRSIPLAPSLLADHKIVTRSLRATNAARHRVA